MPKRASRTAGDPGIGKTRLLAELTEAARAQGLPVIGGTATEFEQHLPFGALAESLTSWVSSGGRVAARFAPLVRDLLGSLPASESTDQYLLGSHRRTRALLEELAAPAGLAVVLDDLHWADPALIGLIGYLTHRPPRGRWVLALGY